VTSDEARDLFSEAYDGELDADAKALFDAALSEDVDLAVEFAEFCELLDVTHDDAAQNAEPPRDLLPGIQRKIRVRSAGRFYRDNFASRMGSKTLMPVVLSVLMLLLLAIALIGISFSEIDQGGAPPEQDAGAPNATP